MREDMAGVKFPWFVDVYSAMKRHGLCPMNRSWEEWLERYSDAKRVALTNIVRPLVHAAKVTGTSSTALATAFTDAIMEEYGPGAAKEVSAKIGVVSLINQEGGAASAKEAAALYGRAKPTSVEAVRKAARLGQLIVVRDGRGQMLFPRWQFSSRGGLWPGIRDTLQALKRHPHFHDLLPLTFFLNPSARLSGKRPLDIVQADQPDDIPLLLGLAEQTAE